jgi:hypothetical protein
VSGYPPEPWRLVGDVCAAVLLVRRGAVSVQAPPGHRLVTVAGRCPAVLVWAAYGSGGELAYHELALALPVRRGWRLRATVARIWVDSPASRDGGRRLWAIPKRLASIGVDGGMVRGVDERGRAVASCAFQPRLRLPGRWPVRFALAQPDSGAARLVAVRCRGRVELGRATVEITRDGPLGDLAGARPLAAARLRSAVLVFGKRRWRRDPQRR